MARSFNRALLVLGLLAGCHRPAPSDGVGIAVATLEQVPANVDCVQFTVVGSRTVVRAFDVQPGQMSTLILGSLPVGNDLFTGAAFATACNAIGGQTPTWTSDPTNGVITPGGVTSVSLVLRPSGAASVGVDFQDDGGSPADLSVAPDLTLPADLLPAPVDLGASSTDLSCVPLTQAAACAGATCGTVSNGCGGTLVCGTCSTGRYCDGYSCVSLCDCGGVYPKCIPC